MSNERLQIYKKTMSLLCERGLFLIVIFYLFPFNWILVYFLIKYPFLSPLLHKQWSLNFHSSHSLYSYQVFFTSQSSYLLRSQSESKYRVRSILHPVKAVPGVEGPKTVMGHIGLHLSVFPILVKKKVNSFYNEINEFFVVLPYV